MLLLWGIGQCEVSLRIDGALWQLSDWVGEKFHHDGLVAEASREGAEVLGMRIAIVQMSLWREGGSYEAVYPSKIYPPREIWKGRDPIGSLLKTMEEVGGKVFLGLAGAPSGEAPEQLERGRARRDLLEWSKKMREVAKELFHLYHKYPSLAGFYITQEANPYAYKNDPSLLLGAVNYIVEGIKRLSPKLQIILPVGLYLVREEEKWRYANPEDLATFWEPIISRSKVDIFLLIDGIGTGLSNWEHSEACQKWLKETCKRYGKKLWVEAEAFRYPYVPAKPEEFLRQLQMANRYGEKVLIFDYPHYLNPRSGKQEAKELWDRLAQLVNKRGKKSLKR